MQYPVTGSKPTVLGHGGSMAIVNFPAPRRGDQMKAGAQKTKRRNRSTAGQPPEDAG